MKVLYLFDFDRVKVVQPDMDVDRQTRRFIYSSW